jgi:hypothetical protein
MRRRLSGMTDRNSQAEYDILRDDGTVPGGGAPVKTGVREADLRAEKELQEKSLTEEEKRSGIKVYARPARYRTPKRTGGRRSTSKYNQTKGGSR